MIPTGLEFAELVRQGNLRSLADMLEDQPRLARSGHTSDGWTPLHLAAWFGHAEVCALLLSRGAKIDADSVHAWGIGGCTALHLASLQGHERIVKLLLANGAKPDQRDGAGYTALHHACEHGHGEVAMHLLRAGADINAFIGDHTPLLLAREVGHTKLVAWLEAHGAVC